MFERFTNRSRRAIVLAQEEARLLNHNYIGTEHVLLGLLAERESAAARVLESLNVTLQAARDQVRDIVGEGQQEQHGHIPFTPRAKKVLELSLREAMSLHSDFIGTEHLLLGLVAEDDGVGAQILGRLGVAAGAVREKVTELAQAEPEPEPEPPVAEVRPWQRSVRIRVDALDEVKELLTSLDRRLAAIERHLGIASDPPRDAPAGPEDPAEPA